MPSRPLFELAAPDLSNLYVDTRDIERRAQVCRNAALARMFGNAVRRIAGIPVREPILPAYPSAMEHPARP
jgi:hypothetical protein